MRGPSVVIGSCARAGARSVVVTFDRHPASIVRPESAPNLLTDLRAVLADGIDRFADD